ncbi:myosin heavy chain, clone 203-like [Helianthus annuus]|uniref:myosin heavy chain, clone 203-like n=1 Tax=Helianthus annuus TaxID=4232 RepID=UPI000B904BA1|nr:myosin heavy chain, clone 203-like [Helianthus annuus]
MASSRDNLKVYIRVTQKKSVSENPKSSKKPKTSSAEENIDEQENISRKSTMKQQRTRKRKDISDNVKKQEEKQKRRRKKVVIESSEDTVSDSKDEKSSRAIVLHTSEQQQVNSGLSKEQRNVVREIGFESILKFKLHSVPRKFRYWLVKNFDAENDEINTGDEKIKITAEFIQKVFQIPNGKTEIDEKLRPKDTDLIIKFWRGFDDAENAEEFSLDKIDSTTLQEFEDELEIAARNEGRCLVMDKEKKVRKNKQKKKDEKDEFYVYPTESENENEEIFEDESEEKDEDDAEEQPITLLKAATDWIDQENQENVQNSPIKTNETDKTHTESGGS